MKRVTVEEFIFKELRDDAYITILDVRKSVIYSGDVYWMQEECEDYDNIMESWVTALSLESYGQIAIHTDYLAKGATMYY